VLAEEISRYNPWDATEVSRRIREEAGLDAALEKLIALYYEIRDEFEITGKDNREAEERPSPPIFVTGFPTDRLGN
jgi:hypothetical protein